MWRGPSIVNRPHQSMKGVKIMDIRKFLSATQIADLEAVSKVLADIGKIKLKGFQPEKPAFDIESAIHRVWSRP